MEEINVINGYISNIAEQKTRLKDIINEKGWVFTDTASLEDLVTTVGSLSSGGGSGDDGQLSLDYAKATMMMTMWQKIFDSYSNQSNYEAFISTTRASDFFEFRHVDDSRFDEFPGYGQECLCCRGIDTETWIPVMYSTLNDVWHFSANREISWQFINDRYVDMPVKAKAVFTLWYKDIMLA